MRGAIRGGMVASSRAACTTLGVVLMLGLVGPHPVLARQTEVLVPPASAQVAPTAQAPALTVSPGGAFLRAILVPGWGHASIGAYGRGGFYFGAQTATVYSFFRTRHRLDEVRSRVRFREDAVRAQALGEGITDETAIEARLEADEGLAELGALLDSRESQQEDLVALGIFILLLSGADAYVSAHLARFPDPLELEARPVDVGRVEVGLRVTLRN